ncbi:MAG: hypothetical protein JNL98_38275, partial [Bryobacterales bacterium]|nr:hypothetical protein [Bryobacterales bacterium]
LFAILVLAGITYAAWRFVHSRDDRMCMACQRPIHGNSRTIALVDGRRGAYCCPACALSEHIQRSKPVDVLSLTDHLTGNKLDPSGAYLVRGSSHNACTHHQQQQASADKRPLETHFDRCAPSILAFATRDQAAAFARDNGGRVVSFEELSSKFR